MLVSQSEKTFTMSSSLVVCSACNKTYRTRNGFARHAVTEHQSLGIGTGALLPLSSGKVARRNEVVHARDHRRRPRVVFPERSDRLMLGSIRVLPVAAVSSLDMVDGSESSCSPLASQVDSVPCPIFVPAIPEDLRRQITAVINSASLRPVESPEAVSQAAGYCLSSLTDVIIASAVVEAQSSLRSALQTSDAEESLSCLLASLTGDVC